MSALSKYIDHGSGILAKSQPLQHNPVASVQLGTAISVPANGGGSSSSNVVPIDKAKSARSYSSMELGVSGLHIANGYIYEEFLPELQGDRGRRVYREMTDNDPTVGALLTAVDSLLKATKWHFNPSATDTSKKGADFAESIFQDMETTWEDTISEILTFLPFGFSLFETVFKRRVGPNETDPAKFSRFNDGLIGLRKLAPRAQESLLRWEQDVNGNVIGFWQLPPQGGNTVYIPMEKALLFRTTSKKDNPEGRSILRNAYSSYYFKKKIQIIESIAIERELNGVPVVRVPSQILVDPAHAQTLAAYKKVVTDLKYNEQAGLVLPSDVYEDNVGKPSSIYKVSVELISATGHRAIDTSLVISRYDTDIARTVLADFLILGSNSRGSFALSKSKTDLFVRSIEGFNNNIAAVINRKLLPTLWRLNGMDMDTMPEAVPGRIAPEDLAELGDYIQKLSTAGFMFAGDEATEARLRDAADLPTEMVTPMDYISDFLNPGQGTDPGEVSTSNE